MIYENSNIIYQNKFDNTLNVFLLSINFFFKLCKNDIYHQNINNT